MSPGLRVEIWILERPGPLGDVLVLSPKVLECLRAFEYFADLVRLPKKQQFQHAVTNAGIYVPIVDLEENRDHVRMRVRPDAVRPVDLRPLVSGKTFLSVFENSRSTLYFSF